MDMMTDWIAFSVDLEPNKDDTLDDITEAMTWFDDVIPEGTVYATYRIATELPDVVERLASDHEIAVHVHPREFGHEDDQLAELPASRQRELILETRRALSSAAGVNESEITAFRAGRHSASQTTFSVLSDLDFTVDASVNVNYTEYLPRTMTTRRTPFETDSGLVEIPTTYVRPSLLSRPGFRTFPQRTLTATANTLRTDRRGCSGQHALESVFSRVERGVSMYMHPYDATDYHETLENGGATFRSRVSAILDAVRQSSTFLTASDVRDLIG